MHPLISILIPVYNAEKWLSETLQSAVEQTWPRKEIIVVDDGSTDGSLTVAHQFESSILRIVANEHEGKTFTVNRALRESQGDYVQYLDADDILAPDKLSIQVERLMSEPANTIATCSWSRFYNDDLRTAEFSQQADFRDYLSPIEWLIQEWGGRATMPPVAWLIPRKVVELAGPWNESLSLNDDTEYFTRIVLNSGKIAFCANARSFYRSGNVSLSGRRTRVALESFYTVCEMSTQHILRFEDSERVRQACANLWQHFIHWVYPEAPDLIRSAEAKVDSFGGASLKLSGSRGFEVAKGVVGWKAVRRLQGLRLKLGR
ncbi:MAG TPA: glycosyltransferase family A protein [Pyrinomonadaceae bacterium]|jgi:glycosyltransferase involved in cell wall biosynthesis